MTKTKELFMKWMQNLFYVQCATLVLALIAMLPFVGSWFSWVIRIATIATIFVLYKLSPLSTRYLKAAIFMGASVLTTILLKGLGVLAIVGMICSLIAIYQEYMGHSELIKEADAKLSKNWNSLFNWEIWGGFLVGGIALPVVLAILMADSSNVQFATNVTLVTADAFNIILQLVYLVLLKRMIKVYAEYEPQVEEEVSNEISD